ncbi:MULTISPECIES: TetR/AcrR family transcriptional regulator [unclassified Streptosporangium]|uniref:TetR/AcrR family transcriptional regulator n=1 Tax=unclassified Streptosporangium TaxID=2632669 RepID=UPI002E281BEA|nr:MULTISPECIES: TetR/AcrR family transcriptional regulator [unclassified Streptosporangium]
MSEPRRRMSGKERREQLIQISRTLFAEKGFDGTSVEEIAATANVSKPVVYEHFGGKEGVYAVVIDREMQKLLSLVTEALSASHSLIKLERAALALLAYVEENSEGFRILVRDSHAASGTGTFASLINDIASQVEDVMVDEFVERGYDPKLAPMYAQMLVGMVALTGQWWLDVRRPAREEVAAHLVNLAWNGLTGLDPNPRLTAASRALEHRLAHPQQRPAEPHPSGPRPRAAGSEQKPEPKPKPEPPSGGSPPRPELPPPPTDKEIRELEKARERELKNQEKLRERELREREKAREREQHEAEKLARDLEKIRLREQRELEKVREREYRERQRLLREQEKARERELRELEKTRLRETKTAEREALKHAKLVGEEREKLEPSE